jgi:SAM-dependent methyltransferase
MENEKIGNIILDYKHYAGRDLYCDGDVEQEILDAVLSGEDAGLVIEKKANWPFLYHLSPLRENIVNWLPIDKDMKVLEVGSGCGAITGALARKAGKVECVDLSRQRSLINANRHKDAGNVVIHVGNFSDIEPDLDNDFDLICLIGVFEYGQAYINGDNPFATFLNILKKHLAKEGSIAIAIENKFGLKYFAGCKEDHVGKYFEGIEDYPGDTPAKTFTEKGLLKIAEECGFSKDSCHMYYPYPDYKFMNTLFSKERLPHIGELKDNLRNFDRDRLYLFDEKLAFDNILKEEEFPLFSNSYMLILGKKPETIYARYSNDRSDDKSIVTEMRDGNRVVKRALSDSAKAHLKKMADNYESLSSIYPDSSLQICNCELSSDGSEISFPFVSGRSLEELFDEKLLKRDKEGFRALYKEFYERVKAGEGGKVSNLDLIFSNVIVSGADSGSGDVAAAAKSDSVWTAIDYEWVVEESIPAKEIAYRALYCYILEDEKRRDVLDYGLLDIIGVTADEEEHFKARELEFQKKVTSGHKSLAELREAIGNEVVDVTGKFGAAGGSASGKLKVYFDDGAGFSEEKSFYPERKGIGFEFEIGAIKERFGVGSLKALRFDPCDYPAIVKIGEITPFSKISRASGAKIGDGVYAFGTADPYFVVNIKEESGVVRASFEVSPIPASIAEALPKESGSRNPLKRLKG